MTTDNPQNQPSIEQINDKTTQISQEIHKDDPGTETIEERGTPLSNFKTQPLHWFWPGHILRGKLTILEGDPGLGKSLFTLDLAARVTTGRPMPDGSPGIQGNVILIAPEDRAPDVIKPRVEAAGGDPSRIRLLSHVHTINPITGIERLPPFTLPVHLPTLVATIKDTRAVLVIIDPLTAVLPSGINGPSDKDIGRGLIPLAEVALTTGCAILIVHHHNKSSFSNPLLFRSGGLLSFLALVRTGLLVVQHPSNENTSILTTTKNNFSAKASNLTYQVVGNAGGIPSIRWLGANDIPTTSLLKRAPLHPQYSFERQALLKTLQASSAPLSPKELAMQTDQDHTLVKQMLRRMLNAGEIVSPCYGLYTSRDHLLTGTPISENNTPIPATPTTLTTLTTPANDSAANLAFSPAIPTTPATLATPTTPATTDQPDSNLASSPPTPTTPATLTTLTTPASDSAANPASSPPTPATPATLATLNHPDSNFTLPPTTPEHNTPITLPTPSAPSIPMHEETSTPPVSFETIIENIRNLLRCFYKDHHLHWIFSTNKAGCPICDTWINNNTNLNPNMRTLYDTLAQHPSRPGESNPTWLHRIAPLL
jgi:hypothetical protein